MRWLVALALVVVALVVMIVRVATKKTKRALPIDEAEIAETAPQIETRGAGDPLPLPPVAAKTIGQRARTGVAIVKGRVLFPTDRRADEEDAGFPISVRADDGQRTVTARMSPDHRYSLRLPPGRYEIVAASGDLVGIAPDIEVEADREREVDILLGLGATIRGTVRGPTDTVTLETVPSGRGSSVEGDFTDVDETFVVRGLIPGRRYDLVFAGRAIRRQVLAGIAAPADGLEVVLTPLPVLRGAVGFARGETCPIGAVRVRTGLPANDEDGPEGVHGVDERCQFELPIPDGAAEITVVATGTGWHLEERVRVPPAGDPDWLCLNPPCREDPLEGLATVRIAFEGLTNARGMQGAVGDHFRSCRGETSACEVEGLPPETTLVTARASGCVTEARTVRLVPGTNLVTFICRPVRRIEGLVRVSGDRSRGQIAVRCRGGGTRYLYDRMLFDLRCAADVSDVEYRENDGPWLRAPVPAGKGDALVEITL